MKKIQTKEQLCEFILDNLKDGARALIGTVGHTAIASNLITAALELSAAKMVAKSDMSSYWKFATISALAGHAASLGKESLKVAMDCSKAEKKVDDSVEETMREDVEDFANNANLSDDPDITVVE